jgi:hypothetical protein
MFYSHKKQYPDVLPDRIRLSNGMTRTDKSTFTEEELADAGYVLTTSPLPYDTKTQSLLWDGDNWVINELTNEEKEQIKLDKWNEVRRNREEMFKQVEWRFARHFSEVRQTLIPTDNIAQLDTHIQALRDITKQKDPFNIIWPMFETTQSEVNSLHLLNN